MTIAMTINRNTKDDNNDVHYDSCSSADREEKEKKNVDEYIM